MKGYTKLFETILDSSVWSEDAATRIVWVAMLAMSDQHGVVEASIPGLARRANVTIGECQAALECFLGPDEYSRTEDWDGRRIEKIDGGWRLLNHSKYRSRLSEVDKREKDAERAKRYRERKRDASVTERDSRDESRKSRHTEAEADAKANTEESKTLHNPSNPGFDDASRSSEPGFDSFWSVVHRKIGKSDSRRAFTRAVDRYAKESGIGKRESADYITAAMREFATTPSARPSDRSAIHPATWLNQGRYEDDRSTWNDTGTPNALKTANNIAKLQAYEQSKAVQEMLE